MAKQIVRQRDFSGGEVVEYAKRRDDEPVVRASTRSQRNVRILSPGSVEQRPGRTALFQEDGRVDEVRMSADYSAYLCFGAGTLTIRNSSGTVVARAWGYAWAAATADDIRWAEINGDVVICFPGQVPKIARWDGGTEWTFLDWAPTTTSAGRKLVPFARLARPGITMALSALTGSVTVTLSENYFTANHVGTRFRYYDKQLTITAVASGLSATATINEILRELSSLDFTDPVTSQFAVGDIIEGATSGRRGYVAEVGTPGSDDITDIRLTAVGFTAGEEVIGPSGSAIFSGPNADPTAAPAITVWDEEVFNATKGWPRSVTNDQSRLIFSDFPGVPDGIAWSAVGDQFNFYPGAEPNEAIFETVPKHARVFHVAEGADEFVITDQGIYYVPISEANPLAPGSVAFRRIPGPSGSAVRPVTTGQGLVYVNGGLNRVLAIVGTGQSAMPWLIRPVSDLHSHLFEGIVCLAVEEGDGDPPDELVYAVNADGTVAVGRYQPGKEWVGWVPWDGEGTVKWISALGDAVLFSTQYDTKRLCEQLDPDYYLDAAVDYDAIPAALGTGAQAAVLIPDDQGSAIGNMSSAGGLAAAFNGTTAQSAASSASRTGVTSGAVGKTFGQEFKIAKAEVWPSNDSGFATVTPITVTLRGKTGTAPADFVADGTQLATTGSIADTTSMQTLTSNDTSTEWDHAWALVAGANGDYYVGEVRFYSPGLTHGSGELWFLPSDTVFMMDGLRNVGQRSTDANGEVTVEEGDSFSDQTFGHVFGDIVIEPFMPHVQGGQSAGQTIKKRQVSRGAVAVQNSTGCRIEAWNRNEEDWDVLKDRGPYDIGDDEGDEPPLREEVVEFGKLGSDHDPRIRIVKDYPGPIRVLEHSAEIDP